MFLHHYQMFNLSSLFDILANSIGYEEVLRKGLLPFYEAHNTFQQEGVPCHKFKVVSSFLDKAMICMFIDWLAQSPDLNIIEPFWSGLKARVSSYKPDHIEALWRACEEQWANIPVPNIKNLYESIPRRIQEVLKKKGFSTR